MSVTLYWGSGSPFAWRAMLALVAKGVDFDDVLLSFSKGEHKTDAYLAMNPRGKVPVLDHDGFHLYESASIMRYVDDAFEGPALFGDGPQERATIDCWVTQADTHVWPKGEKVIRPLFGEITDDARAKVAAAAEGLEAELATLSNALEEGGAIVGSELTAADLAWYPLFALLRRVHERAADKGVDLGILPYETRWHLVAAWMQRIEELPGFRRTWPPHWGEPPAHVA